MLLFGLLLVIFFLNVIRSELYESKPDELSKSASNVKEMLVSLDDLHNLNFKNNIIKRNVLGMNEEKHSTGKRIRVQSKRLRHLPPGLSRARKLLQPRGQRRHAIIGIIARIARIARRVGLGRRGRIPGRRDRLRGRSTSKDRRGKQDSKRRDKGRQIESAAGVQALGEEILEEDAAKEITDPEYKYDYPGGTI
uniref:Uncharacterized protein n=1 Tax=Strongyloides venezuelensis TaxID=75913 RepID=A0A0K0F1V7_STRVS